MCRLAGFLSLLSCEVIIGAVVLSELAVAAAIVIAVIVAAAEAVKVLVVILPVAAALIVGDDCGGLRVSHVHQKEQTNIFSVGCVLAVVVIEMITVITVMLTTLLADLTMSTLGLTTVINSHTGKQ